MIHAGGGFGNISLSPSSPSAMPATTTCAESMPRSPLPVVLVDDEQDLLAATSWLLGSHGIAPVTCLHDGRELMPTLEQRPTGMVLLDLFMPGIGGLELLPQVVEAFREVPVVVMTAAQDVETAVTCISSETGTGKELIARAIHRFSDLPGELVCINVAGLDDNLFADTLFGRVRGAFTGPDRERQGAIAQAAGGTRFLDEMGDLSKASQVKLLRLLQEQKYYPLGSDRQRLSEARVIEAELSAVADYMSRLPGDTARSAAENTSD
jgi:DNA-binding NtrC family response regulator